MNIKLAPFALSALVILVTGCSSPRPLMQTNVLVEPPAHPLEELRSIAIESRDEMRILAKIIEAKNAPSLTPAQHAQKHFQAVDVPAGFEMITSFRYTNEVSRVAEALAKVAGYSFSTTGKKIPNEPIASINTVRLPLNEALRELGAQAGSSVMIKVDGNTKSLTVAYKP